MRNILQAIPYIWALMEKKSTDAYKSIFRAIKNIILGFHMDEALIDYEQALRNALRQEFLDILSHGCFFHYKQVCPYPLIHHFIIFNFVFS